MKPLLWQGDRRTAIVHNDGSNHQRLAVATPVITSGAPPLNTILAVREHAPGEIDELEAEIQSLHRRLGMAYARKRLLEQLLAVIHQADADRPAQNPGITVMR